MLFNPCWSIDFLPEMSMENHDLEVVSEKKLLGLIVRSDLKWTTNTTNLVNRAYKKLWILRRLKILGASKSSLLLVYTKQIRSILEFSVPVWQGSLTLNEKTDIERVQKCAVRIIFGVHYSSYTEALMSLNLDNLESRRMKLCLTFALKAEKNPKYSTWFVPSVKPRNTRLVPPKYKLPRTKHARYEKSPINFLTDLLNKHYSK